MTPLNTITESPSPSYVPRTIANINDSNASLCVLWSPNSVGTVKTIVYARTGVWPKETWRDWTSKTPRMGFTQVHRSYCVVETRNLDEAEEKVLRWSSAIFCGRIPILNIAGHREESQPGIQEFTKELVIRLIIDGVVTERVISGGQTGADRGAWDGAIACGFPIGGTVPAGRRAQDGVIPERYFQYGRHIMTSVTYRSWDNSVRPAKPGNETEVYAFIGPQPECPICGGYGEYEDGGPRGCGPCNSRLIFFVDYRGRRVGADWGDTIERHEDGLHLIHP